MKFRLVENIDNNLNESYQKISFDGMTSSDIMNTVNNEIRNATSGVKLSLDYTDTYGRSKALYTCVEPGKWIYGRGQHSEYYSNMDVYRGLMYSINSHRDAYMTVEK
jgi:hypothetical protein